MDLGATICTPRNPACFICPVSKYCAAREQGIVDQIPAKALKAKRPVRYGVAFALVSDGKLMLERRPPNGLLGGMLGLPGTKWTEQAVDLKSALPEAPVKAAWMEAGEVRHIFTHFELRLQVWRATGRISKDAPVVDLKDLGKAGLPTVFKKAAAFAR